MQEGVKEKDRVGESIQNTKNKTVTRRATHLTFTPQTRIYKAHTTVARHNTAKLRDTTCVWAWSLPTPKHLIHTRRNQITNDCIKTNSIPPSLKTNISSTVTSLAWRALRFPRRRGLSSAGRTRHECFGICCTRRAIQLIKPD